MLDPKRNGSNSREVEPVKTLTSFTRDFTAKVESAASDFYLDRGIGADEILMILLALVYGGWRVAA